MAQYSVRTGRARIGGKRPLGALAPGGDRTSKFRSPKFEVRSVEVALEPGAHLGISLVGPRGAAGLLWDSWQATQQKAPPLAGRSRAIPQEYADMHVWGYSWRTGMQRPLPMCCATSIASCTRRKPFAQACSSCRLTSGVRCPSKKHRRTLWRKVYLSAMADHPCLFKVLNSRLDTLWRAICFGLPSG